MLFGGQGYDDKGDAVFGDTWQWNGARWTQTTPSISPSARSGAATATLNGKIVVFGGMDLSQPSKGGSFNGKELDDTWVWDGANWVLQHPLHSPGARQGAACATLNSKVFLFGGDCNDNGCSGFLSDMWAWDGTDWAELHPAHAPSGRSAAAVAVLNDSIVLFGGDYRLNETWVWDGLDWSQQSPAQSPPPRVGASAATINGRVVLFGGFNGFHHPPDLGDTWEWDGTNWVELHPVQAPVYRSNASLVAFRDKLLLFGGLGGGAGGEVGIGDGPLGDTWEWDGTTWNQLTVTGPSARLNAAVSGF
jgi:N-acetylneuraminic acid mutarotase